MWLAGELVHIEDLVFHDASIDIRPPTNELTRAHAILRARRRLWRDGANWVTSPSGLAALRGRAGDHASVDSDAPELEADDDDEALGPPSDAFAEKFAKLDAAIAAADEIPIRQTLRLIMRAPFVRLRAAH